VDFTNKEVTVNDKMIFVDGVPDIFIDRKTLDEYLDHCLNKTPLDVNVEGDAYANGDEADHYDDVVLDYNCTAWE
jgi:hypothetical protein